MSHRSKMFSSSQRFRLAAILAALCALLTRSGAAAGEVPGHALRLHGRLTHVGEIADGILVRWDHPRAARSAAGSGIEPLLSDRIAVELPAGMSARVEVLGVKRQSVTAPSAFMSGGAGSPGAAMAEWQAGEEPAQGVFGGERLVPVDARPAAAAQGDSGRASQPATRDGILLGSRLLEVGAVHLDEGRRLLPMRVFPQAETSRPGELEVAISLTLAVHLVPDRRDQLASSQDAGTVSGLSSGGMHLDMPVDEDGIYAITPAHLAAAGVDPGALDASRLRFMVEGVETASLLTGDGDAAFEPGEALIGYAWEARSGFTTFPYRYEGRAWIAEGDAAASRMATRAVPPSGAPATSTMHALGREANLILSSDSEDEEGDYYHWTVLGSGPGFADAAFPIPFETPWAVDLGGTAALSVRLHGRRLNDGGGNLISDGPHHVRLLWNGALTDEITWDGLGPVKVDVTLADGEVSPAGNTLTVVLVNDTVANTIYVNRAELRYRRQLTAEGDRLEFTGDGPATLAVTGFSTPDLYLLDITDVKSPVLLTGGAIAADGGSGYRIEFTETLPGPRRYVAAASLLPPGGLAELTLRDLTSATLEADWIAVCPEEFQGALAPLVAHRAAQGLRTMVVSPREVFDAFAGGVVSPGAIRDFLAQAQATWVPPAPRDVLLVGDANLDHFDYLGFGGNFVPTFFETIVGSAGPRLTPTDHPFAAVAGNDDLAELAVGRLPARTAAEVTAMVDKILAYETAPPLLALNRGGVIVSDAPDGPALPDFTTLATTRCAEVAAAGLPCLRIDRAVLGSAAATRDAIREETQAGALLIEYYGASTARQWGVEAFHDKPEIAALANGPALPVVLSFGAQNGLFAAPAGPGGDPAEEGSMLESYLRLPGHGAIAALGATGGTILPWLEPLGARLNEELLGTPAARLGEAVRQAKNRALVEAGIPADAVRMLGLLGDPATPLARAADTDGDGVPDVVDCAPASPEMSLPPGWVGPTVVYPAISSRFAWGPAERAVAYNVYRGVRDTLTTWEDNQVCIEIGNTTLEHTDVAVPAGADSFFFYLIAGRNGCGEGPIGSRSSGEARPSSGSCLLDADGDGVADEGDNCPGVSSPTLTDADGDGLGDPCDTCPNDAANDIDGDGRCAAADNCPAVPNADQTDWDLDGAGDFCDPLVVDFAPLASPILAGALGDRGLAFNPALRYGWTPGGLGTRERVTAAPLELDTFVFTVPTRTWTIELPNGDYHVRILVGDAAFASGPHRVTVMGQTVIADVPTAAGQFLEGPADVEVRGGRMILTAGGTSGSTALALVEIARIAAQPEPLLSVNFQPPGATVPAGYFPDGGDLYSGARGYGWNAAVTSRERGAAVPQVLDTLVSSSAPRLWEVDLAPGTYRVRVTVGDASFASGPHRVVAEGATLVPSLATAANQFIERDGVVTVVDGRLTLEIGGGGGVTSLNGVVVEAVTLP